MCENPALHERESIFKHLRKRNCGVVFRIIAVLFGFNWFLIFGYESIPNDFSSFGFETEPILHFRSFFKTRSNNFSSFSSWCDIMTSITVIIMQHHPMAQVVISRIQRVSQITFAQVAKSILSFSKEMQIGNCSDEIQTDRLHQLLTARNIDQGKVGWSSQLYETIHRKSDLSVNSGNQYSHFLSPYQAAD